MNSSHQKIDDNFIRIVDNFLNICENSTDFSRHRDRLNAILNDLNSTELQLIQSRETVERTIDIFKGLIRIPLEEDTIIVKCSCLIVRLLNKNAINLPVSLFQELLDYLIKFIRMHKNVGACDALRLMQIIIKNHFKCETIEIGQESKQLIDCFELLLNLLNECNETKTFTLHHYDGYTNFEIKNATIFCLESILWAYDKISEIGERFEDGLTQALIKLIYSIQLDEMIDEKCYCMRMRSALNACRYIGYENRDWCKEYLGDILGACISNMLFGLPDIEYQLPKKVQSSQQTIVDKQNPNFKKGGKLIKGRRPRQRAQAKARKASKSNQTNEKDDADNDLGDSAHSVLFNESKDRFVINTFTTSDSDASDPETGRVGAKKREREAKLRLAALSLLGVVARNVEKRIFFGYWHSLFPTEELTASSVALLNCVLRDPNQRCRIAALQATSNIIYGTKSFLIQAETTEHPPSTFMPFSISLGNQIRILYISLTQALQNESSLPVLTQILKCLAVLVQSTTFHKLQRPPGLISKFVLLIRRLVHHKDLTIKLGALIVMEFLIARPEITDEIYDCVGLSRTAVKSTTNIHDFGENDVIDVQENEIDSEYEDDDELGEQLNSSIQSNDSVKKISWLLQIALETLGVQVNSYTKPREPTPFYHMRHQCLQIVLVMASQFIWIKSHLMLVAQALENTLQDDIASVRHQATRCLDIIANSISTHLVAQSHNKTQNFECDVDLSLEFWSKMFPIITQQLQDLEQTPRTRWTFCDAYSNIGVHVYERLARSSQIHTISMLSGIALGDDEPEVRASAVRALAIFVLFPSLKEDICYIENTIEAIFKILYNDVIYVRVKASWSLANVTDVLVLNISDPSVDQISENLFLKLFEYTMATFNDNEKVRMNAVRIYGNLLRLINENQLTNKRWQSICLEAIKNVCEQAKIVATGSNVKVKWNACYAIGNFMKNAAIFDLDGGNEMCWQELVFTTLTEIIVNCANFKVRINGAIALATPAKREFYGKYYLNVWSALSIALFQANQLTDFNEYNHRDNLLNQLCITISHLIILATPDDLIDSENILLQHLDSNKQNWIRVINRMVPEKAASLLEANLHLKKLCSSTNLTSEQRNAAAVLANCFVSITEYDD